jgi:uncharacterized protein YjbI with pentapeptide repeats
LLQLFFVSDNTEVEEMKRTIVWMFCLAIIVLLMATGVQAQKLREVNATEILKQIENGEDIFLENVRITGKLDLRNINLKNVSKARFAREIEYYGLEKELKIVESEIKIPNSFFEEDVDFSNTEIRKDIDFSGTSFLRKSDFSGANFARGASFKDANFTGGASFNYANFAKTARFRDTNFAGDASFKDANFTGDAIFFPTEFDKAYFRGTTFTNVSLNETDYNQMNVEWSTLKDALIFDGPTYIKLIKNFREMEQFEDADAAYYQYRQLSQKNKEWSFPKLMDVVAGVSCGYGVKPGYPLIWGFILIIVFALVYKLGNGIKRLKLKENGDNRVSFWDAFYFSLVTFSTVGYGDWYPEDRYRKFVMIEGVLGWLLLALFIVTLANVMIRP